MEVKAARILVVDDDKVTCDLLSEALAKEGFDIEIATDSTEAKQRAQSIQFDVVITDLEMPRLNGAELLQEIKRQKPSTQVILVSASQDKKAPDFVKSLGAYEFIVKPIKISNMVQTVKDASQRARTWKD